MAVAKKYQADYERDFEEMKLNLVGPYVKQVLEIGKMEDTKSNRDKIYSLVKGFRKDYEILNFIRIHLGLTVNKDSPGQIPNLKGVKVST
jgi:hypothetical protein